VIRQQDTCQVKVKGQAILFETGIYAKMPADMDEALALAILDVAGAPAQAAKLSKPGQTVFIIGAGGKSGLLCAYEARKRVKPTGKVICLVHGDAGKKRLEKSGFADVIIQGSATDQLFVYEEVKKATGGEMADLTINCVDIPNTEMASVLATKDDGWLLFSGHEFHVAPSGGRDLSDTMISANDTKTTLRSGLCRRESPIRRRSSRRHANGAGNPEPVGIKPQAWPCVSREDLSEPVPSGGQGHFASRSRGPRRTLTPHGSAGLIEREKEGGGALVAPRPLLLRLRLTRRRGAHVVSRETVPCSPVPGSACRGGGDHRRPAAMQATGGDRWDRA
jgi:hypothetical protein